MREVASLVVAAGPARGRLEVVLGAPAGDCLGSWRRFFLSWLIKAIFLVLVVVCFVVLLFAPFFGFSFGFSFILSSCFFSFVCGCCTDGGKGCNGDREDRE
jgi:hypothetical protein